MSHLHLRLKVGDGTQTANDERRVAMPAEVNGQAVKRFDVYAGRDVRRANFNDRLANDLDTLFRLKDVRGLVGIDQNAEHDPIEYGGGALNHIEMAVRDRVE
jgi:hypothetical protein